MGVLKNGAAAKLKSLHHRVIWWTLEAPKYRPLAKNKDYIIFRPKKYSLVGWRKNQPPYMPKNLRKKIGNIQIFHLESMFKILKKIESKNFFRLIFYFC